MKYAEMTYEQRLVHLATAPRVTAKQIQQVVDHQLRGFWIGRLRGKFVGGENSYKHDSREAALDCARKIRADCRAEAERKGLLSPNA